MKLSVLIPSYQRSDDLSRCITALKGQSCPADEIIIVIRDTDIKTSSLLKHLSDEKIPLKIVSVSSPGQVVALNAGLKEISGDIIAITDDDAVPHQDWLEKIKAYFLADSQLGGVGGRDHIYINGIAITEPNFYFSSILVGKLKWFGKPIGNHHIGVEKSSEVDILKGVNMSYRRLAIQGLYFDIRLLGNGAQVCNDMAFSLAVKRRGWKLIYDPNVSVDHFQGIRDPSEQRYEFSYSNCCNYSFNETLTVMENITSIQKVFYLAWSFLIGSRDCFGLAQLIRFLYSERIISIKRWQASMEGRIQALMFIITSNRNHAVVCIDRQPSRNLKL